MSSIRLHPADCEKYRAPEVLEFELAAIGVRQRSALQKASKRSLSWMFDQLSGVPELDEQGNAIPEPVIDPETGEQQVENGVPVVTERLTRDPEAVAMLVWMVLWGAGIHTPWDTFDIREIGLKITLGAGDEDEEQGKDEEQPTSSEATTTS